MSEKRPVIGVTPGRHHEDPTKLVVPEMITKAIERLGGEVRMLDYDKLKTYELIGEAVQLDGVLYAGGGDVDPAVFGQEREPECGPPNHKRDDLEMNLMPLILTRGVPVLGICRGCQSVNVALGGTLVQDIPKKYGVNHQQHGISAEFFHDIKIEPGTRLYDAMQKTTLLTNSYHHQCVDVLAPGMIASAWSQEGFIEAFESPRGGQFIMGIQWHPESTQDLDKESMKVFEMFMDAVNEYMSVPCHHG